MSRVRSRFPCEADMSGGQEADYWPLSGKPFFDMILSKSHVHPRYNLVTIGGLICGSGMTVG